MFMRLCKVHTFVLKTSGKRLVSKYIIKYCKSSGRYSTAEFSADVKNPIQNVL